MKQNATITNDISAQNPIFGVLLDSVKKDNQVLAVSVFGSFARQEQYNDIDICLFLAEPAEKTRVLAHYIKKFNDPLDIKAFSLLPLYVRIRVMKEGKILLNKDFDQVCQIYLQTISDYNLFEPHFQTFLDTVNYG